MPTVDFLPFGTSAGANVTSQANYIALAARFTGFVLGVADPAEANKALRQGTSAAAALALFASLHTGQDVLDDGDTAGFAAKLLAAIEVLIAAGIAGVPPADIVIPQDVGLRAFYQGAGTYSWLCPANIKVCTPKLLGAAGAGYVGAGGTPGSGGGGSGFSAGLVNVTPGVSYEIILGAPGQPGSPGGGCGCFGLTVTAGGNATADGPGSGGVGAGGVISLTGGNGGYPVVLGSTLFGGSGGAPPFGFGTNEGTNNGGLGLGITSAGLNGALGQGGTGGPNGPGGNGGGPSLELWF